MLLPAAFRKAATCISNARQNTLTHAQMPTKAAGLHGFTFPQLPHRAARHVITAKITRFGTVDMAPVAPCNAGGTTYHNHQSHHVNKLPSSFQVTLSLFTLLKHVQHPLPITYVLCACLPACLSLSCCPVTLNESGCHGVPLICRHSMLVLML